MVSFRHFAPWLPIASCQEVISDKLQGCNAGAHFTHHYPLALKSGIKKEIADGRRPQGMSDDEEIVYDFSIELHRNKRASDTIFQRAEKRFGKQGIVDMTGISGYYTLLAMELNMAQYELPKDGKKLERFPK